MCGSTHVVAYIFEVPRDQLHLLRSIVLEPFQRTELCLLVPPCLSSVLCIRVLTCLAACAGNAAADAGSQRSSAAGCPGQAQGVRAGKAAAAAAVCDFYSRHSCKQCKGCCGCGRQVSVRAAGAAGCQGRDGMQTCSATSSTSAAASLMQFLLPTVFACSDLFLIRSLYFPSRLHLSLQSLELLLEGDCCHCCQPSRVTDEHR